MIDSKNLSFYADLQQSMLDTDDTEVLVIRALNQVSTELSILNITIKYLSAIFLDEEKQIALIYTKNSNTAEYEQTDLKTNPEAMELYEKTNKILNTENRVKLDLQNKKVALIQDKDTIIPSTAPGRNEVQAILIAPVYIAKGLRGLIVYGVDKTPIELDQAQLQVFKMISNLIGSSYRLQDSQTSITAITQELYKTNAQLHQLDKMKDQLIAVTSHELRTPATVVQNYLWMVLSKPSAGTILSDKDKERLQNSFTGIQNLIHLINDILDVSKIESGSIQLNIQPVKYTEIIEELIRDLTPKAQSKNIVLKFTKEADLPETIQTDSVRVKEILINLISNAVKFTDKGSVTIHVCKKDDNIQFEIKDTGRGIAADFVPSLFKKFHREDTSLTASNPETGGTGLGLYITKSMTEIMQGKIWVDSEHGKGSTFYISLPIVPNLVAQSKPIAAPAFIHEGVITRSDYLRAVGEKIAGKIPDKKVDNRKRILLIEDDPDMQDLYGDYLSEQYNITLAGNGHEGLEKMENGNYDLVLLDIMMPKMDGVEFLEKKKNHQKNFAIPVVLLTNLAAEDVLNRCIQLGAKSLIMKSDITPDQIPPVINQVLQS
ncbi:MAG: ATP-binding protein [bacterium]|nr:ATP-binding protein [bacterium]